MANKKINPTGRQKGIFVVHLLIYLVATAVMFFVHHKMEAEQHRWVYPLHAWIIAAWGLAVIGHGCALWTSYEDAGMDDYVRQTQNG